MRAEKRRRSWWIGERRIAVRGKRAYRMSVAHDGLHGTFYRQARELDEHEMDRPRNLNDAEGERFVIDLDRPPQQAVVERHRRPEEA